MNDWRGYERSFFIPLLTDSKTPTSRFREYEEDKWESGCPSQAKATGRGALSVISSTNHSRGMKENHH
jgi:hypothetical protein